MSKVVQALVAAASIVIIIAGLKASSGIVGPILFAFTVTLLIVPILQWLKKKGLPSWLAISVLSGALLLLFWLLALLVYNSATLLIEKLPIYQTQIERQIAPLQESAETLSRQWGVETNVIVPREVQNGSAIVRTILSFLTGLVESSTNVGFFLFTVLLMLIASDNVIKKSKRYFREHQNFAQEFREWSENIQEQYKIQSISNLMSAALVTTLFLVMRIDFALLWGVLTFLLAYIPNIGIIISSIPPVLLAFIQYGPWGALIVLGFIVGLNIIMDNIVTPRFMGKGLEIPASIVFLSFIFWSYVFGLLGAFLALPITLAIRSALLRNKKTKYVGDLLSN
jgi:AI-2 transport protein TqsA